MFLIDGIVDSDSHLTSSFSWLFVSFPHLCFVSLAEPFFISLGRQRVQCEMWLGLWNVLSCWSPCSGPGAGRSGYTNKQHNLYLSLGEAPLYQCQVLSFPRGSEHRWGVLVRWLYFPKVPLVLQTALSLLSAEVSLLFPAIKLRKKQLTRGWITGRKLAPWW